MGKTRRFAAIFLAILMLALAAASASAATGVNQQGRTVCALGDNLFVALDSTNGSALSVLPKDGGEMTRVDTQTTIDGLVSVGEYVYYLRYDPPAFQLVRAEADGKLLPLKEFEGQDVHKLSYYDDMLYVLVDNVLTMIDPESGESDALNPSITMTDYVIVNDVIYYVSATDTQSYELNVKDETVTESSGKLYSMSILGNNPELVLDKGVKDLQAHGNYIYLHNLDDAYPTESSEGVVWMVGKLYRVNVEANYQLISMNLAYDWTSTVTDFGVVVYTSRDVSLYPLTGGAAKQLMAPKDDYTTVTATNDTAYVYEHTQGVLTALPLAGGDPVVLYQGGPIVDLLPGEGAKAGEVMLDEEGNPILDENGDPVLTPEDETTGEEVTPTATQKPSSSSSGKTGGYIFPNSSKKKLTRSQILDVSKSQWGYGRNEIYARHGYVFKTKKYKDYFAKKSWYKAGGFSTKNLNSTEWYNMELLRSMEKEYGLIDDDGRSTSSSSSGRITLSKNVFKNSSTKKLTKSQVSKLSKEKLAIARNEILARHGYPFKQSKWKNYFKGTGWKARSSYSYSKLNSIEKYNIELIKKYE